MCIHKYDSANTFWILPFKSETTLKLKAESFSGDTIICLMLQRQIQDVYIFVRDLYKDSYPGSEWMNIARLVSSEKEYYLKSFDSM